MVILMTSSGAYKIETVSDSAYKLNLIYDADSKLVNKIFQKAKKQLKRKKNIDITKELESFEVPPGLQPKIFPVLFISCRKNINEVSRIMLNDGIIMLSAAVSYATYTKKLNHDWEILITISGEYTRK